MTDKKEPKDLGIKIGTEEEVFWRGVKKKCEDMLAQCKHEIVIQETILKLATEMIKIEEPKLKKEIPTGVG